MKHLIIFEDFDLDKFLSSPEEYFHDNEDEIGIGAYVKTYRGNAQIVDETPEFWVVKLMDSSEKNVKVPKESVTKMDKEMAKSIKGSLSSKSNTKKELDNISDSIDEFMDGSVTDEDGEWKYRGNIQTAMDFMNDTVLDIISLYKRDQNMKYYAEFDRLTSALAILIDNVLESCNQDEEVKKQIDSIVSAVGSLGD
jgi:hypothetical protein